MVRFVDRDMFMRYTGFGIGHPVMLRKFVRDCISSDLMAPTHTMDTVDADEHEDDIDGEGNDARDAVHDEDDEESSDEELSDESSSEGDGEDDLDEDEFDLLSF
jgi:hypothetical protein